MDILSIYLINLDLKNKMHYQRVEVLNEKSLYHRFN